MLSFYDENLPVVMVERGVGGDAPRKHCYGFSHGIDEAKQYIRHDSGVREWEKEKVVLVSAMERGYCALAMGKLA